jgi:hypothetical protein
MAVSHIIIAAALVAFLCASYTRLAPRPKAECGANLQYRKYTSWGQIILLSVHD